MFPRGYSFLENGFGWLHGGTMRFKIMERLYREGEGVEGACICGLPGRVKARVHQPKAEVDRAHNAESGGMVESAILYCVLKK